MTKCAGTRNCAAMALLILLRGPAAFASQMPGPTIEAPPGTGGVQGINEPLPDGCKYYPQLPTKVLPDGARSYYAPTITKRDIVCLGKSITVNSVLRSNGGSVLIAADTLTLNAPIDSRIYFNHSDIYWPSQVPYVAPGNPNADLGWVLDDWRPLRDAFDMWYLRQEYYVAERHTYEWAMPDRGPALSRRDHQLQNITALLAAPQLPFALSNPAPLGSATGARNSDAPLTPDLRAIRSGDITLVVNKLVLCPDCGPQPPGFADPMNGGIPVMYRAMLNAGGAYGGRGAAGIALAPQSNRSAGQFGYYDQFNQGVSGTASSGGDAGDVEVYGVNDTDSPLASDLIKNIISVAGGRAPYGGRLITAPSPIFLSHPGLNADTFISFANQPSAFSRSLVSVSDATTPTLASLSGASGNATVKDGLTSDDAINVISDRISLLALHTCDAKVTADETQLKDPFIGPYVPRAQLDRYITDRLVDTEAALLNSTLDDLTAPSPSGQKSIEVDAIFKTIKCNGGSFTSINAEEIRLISDLCIYNRAGIGPLSAFWSQEGGLYSEIPTRIADAVDQLKDNAIGIGMLARLDQVVGTLQQISDNQLTQMEIESRKNLTDQLASLRSSSDALRDKLHSSNAWDLGLAPVQGLFDATAAAWSALDDAASQSSAGSSKSARSGPIAVANVGDKLTAVYKAWEAYRAALAGDTASADKLSQVLEQIERIQAQLVAFDRAVNERREKAAALQSAALKMYVEDTEKVAALQRSMQERLFVPMYRDVVQRFVGYPETTVKSTSDQLQYIEEMLRSFPKGDASWSYTDQLNPCASAGLRPLYNKVARDKRCVKIPENQPAVATLYSDRYPTLPLYVARPGGAEGYVPVGALGSSNLTLQLEMSGNPVDAPSTKSIQRH